MNNATLEAAPGRLHRRTPLAVVDIGSNSVRLVVYEGLARAPTALFNEKALCGLGREVQTTGLLAADAVEQALGAVVRYARPWAQSACSQSQPQHAVTPRTARPSSSLPRQLSAPRSRCSRAHAR